MIPGVSAHPHRVVEAASGTLAGLQAAEATLLAAFSTGGTVQIPAGTHLFSGPWIIDDIINLQGKSGAVLDKNNNAVGFANPMIDVIPTAVGRKWRCRGFKLLGNWDFGNDNAVNSDIGLYANGSIDMRIYNMDFQQFGRTGIQTVGSQGGAFRGHPRGVIWDCTFTDMLDNTDNIGYGVEVVGDDQDTTQPTPGDGEFLYIEDCTFTRCRHTVVGNNEARYVARHNDVFEQRKNSHSMDSHGKAGWPRGTRWIEWYNNTVHSNNIQNSNFGHGMRGGGGVIFENDLDNTIANERYGLVLEGWSGLSAADKVYPSPFQIGDLEDLWGWNNRYKGAAQTLTVVTSQGGGSGNIVEGRDYFNFVKPGYTAYQYPHDKRNAL